MNERLAGASPPRRRSRRWAVGALALASLAGAAMTATMATGSSHREAPLIADDPAADNTDLYAFVSPDRPDSVTVIANYIPLEEPAGGPNFHKFADDVLYAVKVDNTGDGEEDITYEFNFRTRYPNKNTFLYNTGQVTSLDDPDLNSVTTYTVRRVRAMGGSTVIGRGVDNLQMAPANVGPRSTPNYEALEDEAVYTIGNGIKVFAGPRDDPFFVDLGSIFDLAGLRPFNPFHLIPLPAAPGVDDVSGYNTHTIAMQIPIDQLTSDGQLPTGADDPQGTIGIYASAERKMVKIFRGETQENQGPFTQVSRLGNPLINEVIIPIGKKDRWNASDPSDDSKFVQHYRNPEVPGLVNLLYPGLPDAPTTGREDLVAVLLTGVPGLNFTGPTKADLLRLNTGIPPSGPVGTGNRLGVLAGEFAGFPNGRRLEDDVTDIEIRALACGYGDILQAALSLCNLAPNNVLGDGVDTNDVAFDTTFPYVPTPHQGYSHEHDHAGS